MTPKPLAVLDTNVVILLFGAVGARKLDPSVRVRCERTEIAVKATLDAGAKLVLPTPVLAELSREGPGSTQWRRLAEQLKRNVRAEPLGVEAADVAGAMRRVALQRRGQRERGAVSYDALIAAIAHTIGARWLLTENRDDMETCFRAVGSQVEVVDTSAPPKKGQLALVHAQQVLPSSAGTEAPARPPKKQR